MQEVTRNQHRHFCPIYKSLLIIIKVFAAGVMLITSGLFDKYIRECHQMATLSQFNS